MLGRQFSPSRRPVVVLAIVLAAAAAGPAAFGAHGRSDTRCGGKMSVLVWPHGHDVIPSVSFPAVVNPHVEVYVGWSEKYPEALYGGYVVGGPTHQGGIPAGNVNLRLHCIDYGTPAKATATVSGGVTIAAQTALTCTISGSGVFDLLERGRGSRVLILHSGAKVLLRADVSRAGASVTVPKGACTKRAVPR